MGSLTCVLRDEENVNHLLQFLSALNVGAGSSAALNRIWKWQFYTSWIVMFSRKYCQSIFKCIIMFAEENPMSKHFLNETFPIGLV